MWSSFARVNSITAAQRTQTYTLVGVPAYLKRDETDDLLNPSRGYRAPLGAPSHSKRLGDNGENAARNLAYSRAWHVVGVKGRDQPLLVIETAEERP